MLLEMSQMSILDLMQPPFYMLTGEEQLAATTAGFFYQYLGWERHSEQPLFNHTQHLERVQLSCAGELTSADAPACTHQHAFDPPFFFMIFSLAWFSVKVVRDQIIAAAMPVFGAQEGLMVTQEGAGNHILILAAG